MSEQNPAPMDDMELISLYINEQLPEEQMEQVRERLATDEEFRYLAEPMMFASAMLRQEMSRPRPPGELEKHWDSFTRRAGFAHQRKRARTRRLWILGIVVAILGISGFLVRGRIQNAYRDWRDYAPVNTDPTSWISLQPNIQVLMQRQTRMRAAKALLRQAQHVKLVSGTVRVRVELADTTDLTVPNTIPLVVHTPAGVAFSAYGHFSVTVNGDTTIVEAHAPLRERYQGIMPFPSMTMVRSNDESDPVRVPQDTRVRLVRGFNPERIR